MEKQAVDSLGYIDGPPKLLRRSLHGRVELVANASRGSFRGFQNYNGYWSS